MRNERSSQVQESESSQECGSELASEESGFQESTGAEERSSQWASRRAAATASYQAARKEAQRQAYQKAKERRAKDPRYLQLKETAKARRREHYERVKQHRKAAQTALKAARSVQRAATESEARAFYKKGRVKLGQATPPAGLAGGLEASVSALVANAVVANDVS
jgi:hypothetical protein